MDIATLKNRIRTVLSIVLIQGLLIFFLGTTSVKADGEYPIKGEIVSISGRIIVVKVTEKGDTGKNKGESVLIRRTHNTRTYNKHLKRIPFSKLVVGLLVSIEPQTLPTGDVDADMIHVIER